MLIDSHCHLDYFGADEIDAILTRATAAGVGEMVTIGTRLTESGVVRGLAAAHPNVWCTVGVHPHNAGEGDVPTPEAIAAEAAHPRVIGIGESGRVPLAIHARDADADIAAILQDEWDKGGNFMFLLHCFSSTRALAETGVRLGGSVSFSGILTFPKSVEIREIARDIPLDRLLVETDAPYLAPVPRRGKRNEPAFVVHTAAVLAQVRGMEPAALADLTTANFRKLFRKAA
jgi:TatD DNase family protein